MSLTPHGRLQLVPPPPHLLSFPTRRSSDLSHAALIIFFPRFWRLLAVQAAAGLLGFIVFYLMFTVVPEWLGQTSVIRDSMRFGLSKREVIWQLAWDMFVANPWLGVGPMHFSAEVNSVAAHPHQVVLQWLAEWEIGR